MAGARKFQKDAETNAILETAREAECDVVVGWIPAVTRHLKRDTDDYPRSIQYTNIEQRTIHSHSPKLGGRHEPSRDNVLGRVISFLS